MKFRSMMKRAPAFVLATALLLAGSVAHARDVIWSVVVGSPGSHAGAGHHGHVMHRPVVVQQPVVVARPQVVYYARPPVVRYVAPLYVVSPGPHPHGWHDQRGWHKPKHQYKKHKHHHRGQRDHDDDDD